MCCARYLLLKKPISYSGNGGCAADRVLCVGDIFVFVPYFTKVSLIHKFWRYGDGICYHELPDCRRDRNNRAVSDELSSLGDERYKHRPFAQMIGENLS